MATELKPLEPVKIVWGPGNACIDFDLKCAATTNGGVLVTGPPEKAEAIAFEIHRRRSSQPSPFDVADCDDPDCLRTLECSVEGGTLFLRNVDRLSPSLQARVFTQIGGLRRIVAWSRECPDRSLDPTLFYRLNMIHIALS